MSRSGYIITERTNSDTGLPAGTKVAFYEIKADMGGPMYYCSKEAIEAAGGSISGQRYGYSYAREWVKRSWKFNMTTKEFENGDTTLGLDEMQEMMKLAKYMMDEVEL